MQLNGAGQWEKVNEQEIHKNMKETKLIFKVTKFV